jgi:hypothetical protein
VVVEEGPGTPSRPVNAVETFTAEAAEDCDRATWGGVSPVGVGTPFLTINFKSAEPVRRHRPVSAPGPRVTFQSDS